MKKLLLITSLAGILSVSAISVQRAGFQDNGASLTGISDAIKMADDSYVTIQGNIVKRVSDDKYIFKDSTGTMTVEIDTEKWAGQTVNMSDKLELTGEIEKKLNSTILDVDTVKVISK